MTDKIFKTRTLMMVLGLVAITFVASQSVLASGPCTPVLFSPVLTGTGATCAAATADLNYQLDDYVEVTCVDGECGDHLNIVTVACQTVNGHKEVKGYSRYSCYGGWGEFAELPVRSPSADE